MLYCPNFFWNVLQVWMTGKDVYLQMTWSWPDKTWNILCSYCLQWNTSQSKFRNHYFLFYLRFPYCPNFFWFGVVHDMTLVLLKSNGKMLMKWLSEQFLRCLFMCLCPHLVRRQTLKSLRASRALQSVCREQTALYTFESLSRMSNTDQSAPRRF